MNRFKELYVELISSAKKQQCLKPQMALYGTNLSSRVRVIAYPKSLIFTKKYQHFSVIYIVREIE